VSFNLSDRSRCLTCISPRSATWAKKEDEDELKRLKEKEQEKKRLKKALAAGK
jgi:hypothetical protein